MRKELNGPEFVRLLEVYRGDRTIEEFSKIIGVSPKAYYDWRRGANVTEHTVIKVLSRLDLCLMEQKEIMGALVEASWEGTLEGTTITIPVHRNSLREGVMPLRFKEDWLRGRVSDIQKAALFVIDKSHDPELLAGDIVLVDKTKTHNGHSGVFLYDMEGVNVAARSHEMPNGVSPVGQIVWISRDLI